MSRAVIYEKFGGPEVLELREVPEPHAGEGEVRVRVAAIGLNPMDPGIASKPELAAMFGVSVPSGFGYDFAGVIDEIGAGVKDLAVGHRVFGGAMAKAAADFLVLKSPTRSSPVRSPCLSPRPSRSSRPARPRRSRPDATSTARS